MRIYRTFPEALRETHRDLSEMGIQVHAKTYQDKDVSNDPGFATLELQNYNYVVLKPDPREVELGITGGRTIVPTQPWADAEFSERVYGAAGSPVNPGEAWTLRENIWETFLEEDGKFSYTYSHRFSMFDQVVRIIDRIKKDPDSRQLWLSVWHPRDITKLGGISRVPCTLGYQFAVREGILNIHYIQRSADFITHFCNDVYLASRLQAWVAEKSGYPVGHFSHTVFSLHMFRKDAEGVF